MMRRAFWAALAAGFFVAAVLVASGCPSRGKEELTAKYASEIRTKEGLSVFRGGKLVISEGVPVLTLTGTPYEMGLSYGVLLRERIRSALTEVNGFKDALIASRNVFERAVAPIYISAYTGRMAKRIPREYLDELSGVADGSGVPLEELVFAAAGAGIFSEPMPVGSPHCTSILARLPDRVIHGRNFDFLPALMGNYPVIVHYMPQGGNGYWSFGVIGYTPSFHGINDKGISVTLNYGVASYDASADGMPATFKIRNILKNASNLGQVKSIIDATPADEPGWILTVGSAGEGKGAVFDVMGHVRAESEFTEQDSKLILNRQFSYTRYPDGKLARKYLYISDGEGEYNVARFDSGTKYLAAHPMNSSEDMLGFLRQADFYGYHIPLNNNATIVNDYTLHTLVFDWKNKTVLFAWGVAYAALHPVYAFDLKTDTLSKHTPADPLLATRPYAAFVGAALDTQIHSISEDGEWLAGHTDPATADPYAILKLVELWEEGKSHVSRDTLLAAADRLMKTYPDYDLPYSIKARLMKKADPREAIRLYNLAIDARINFVTDRIALLARLAEVYDGIDAKDDAKAAAARCLGVIEEMSGRYALDEWVKEIRKKMKKLAE